MYCCRLSRLLFTTCQAWWGGATSFWKHSLRKTATDNCTRNPSILFCKKPKYCCLFERLWKKIGSMVLLLTIPAHTFAVNFSLNWSFLIRRKFCWAQYRVFRRLNMLFVIHQKNRRKKQNCGFHHQCEATNHSNPVFDQHHLHINILKRHGTEAWFIYHYGYFYQVMINPLNALFLMLSFIWLYTHFL
jgi:hypothetical protein